MFLVAKYGDSQFRTAAHIHGKAVRMSMRDYVTYMAVHIKCYGGKSDLLTFP